LLLKDLDHGLSAGHEFGVPMPVAASTRETVQIHIGAAMLQKDPDKYLSMDFGALLETMALTAGIKVSSENKKVLSGLEI
jgi:3-hydroxyisobutyrate dehydrogenase